MRFWLGGIAGTIVVALAAPALGAEINIYSYRQPHLIAPLLERFEANTGIETKVLSLQKGLIERVKAEGELSPADVILTVDIGRLTSAVHAGVTQPILDSEIAARVPASLRDPDGHWIGITTRARIVYASRDRTQPGEIGTYEELADPKWKGRICTRSGRHRYNVALLAAVIAHHGPEAAESWLQGVKANLARRPQGNDRAQVKAIWAGECDISIGNTYYMGKMLDDPEQQAWAESVRVEFPVFENGGVHVNVSGVAIARNAPNLEEALELVRFLVSAEAQSIYAEVNHEYPVTADAAPSELVASWGSFEPDSLTLTEIADFSPAAVKLVDAVAFDDAP